MYRQQNPREGKLGDRRKDGKYTYEKSNNGRWKLVENDALKKHLHSLYVKKGLGINPVSKETGIPYSVTQQLLAEFGFLRTHAGKANAFEAFMQKNFKRVLRMYEKGQTLLEISQILEDTDGRKFPRSKYLAYFKANDVHIRDSKEAHAVATETGRKTHEKPAGMGLFKPQATNSWHYHLDLNLSGLTFEQYKRIVYRFTYMVTVRYPKMFPANVSMQARRGEPIDLDHQLSIFNGFHRFDGKSYVARKRPLALEVMCHPANLKLMCRMTNMKKHSQNHLSLEQLTTAIAKHQEKHGDIFDDYYGRYTKEDYVKKLARK